MTVQKAAFFFAMGFIVVAIAGFFATGLSMDADPGTAPRVFNVFPVNAVHNVVHLAFGLIGLVTSRGWSAARWYCRVGGAAYLVLAGVAISTPDLFGVMPIGGPTFWLHLGLGIGLLWFGLAGRDARHPLPGGGVAPSTSSDL
jgi:hypothetical protein